MATQYILSNTGLSTLKQKFSADMTGYDPLLYGMVSLSLTSVSDDINISGIGVTSDDVATVTITIKCNNNATVNCTYVTVWDSE